MIVISNNELVIIDDECNVHMPMHEGTFTFLDQFRTFNMEQITLKEFYSLYQYETIEFDADTHFEQCKNLLFCSTRYDHEDTYYHLSCYDMEAREYVSFGNSEQNFMKYTVNFIYNGTLLFIADLNKISTFKIE